MSTLNYPTMKLIYIAPLAALVLPSLPDSKAPEGVPAVRPSALVSTWLADDDEDENEHNLDVRDAVTLAKVTLHDAVARALAARPGKAVEAELEGELRGKERVAYYDVMIIDAAGALVEMRVNAATGATEVGDEEENEDATEFLAALRHSELDLGTLIERAGTFVRGTPVSAKLEFDDGNPVCELTIANTRWLIEVELEARAGHLLEIEVLPELQDSDEDEARGHGDGDDEAEGDDDDEDEDEDDEEGEDDDDDDDDDDGDDD